MPVTLLRRIAGFAAVAAALGAALVPSTSLAAPVNDSFANRLTLQLGSADTRSNTDATIETGEPLTPNDPGGLGCGSSGAASSTGVQSSGTLWWDFIGTGGPITVSSLGSNFDTVLGVYNASDQSLVACNDDIQPGDPTRPNLEYRPASEVLINTVSGQHYAVQVGGCTPHAGAACDTKTSGSITLRASAPPANDNRAAARAIAAGAPINATNTGATTEPNEVLSCHWDPGHTSPYAKTVWFKWSAPARGTAVFSSSGFDTVLAVYRGSSLTPLGCNDDAAPNQAGGSQLPAAQPAGPPVQVVPGTYFIQVGGYYDPGFSQVAARNGPLTAQVQFAEDKDIDNDGVSRPRDCNDQDPAIRPGATEIPNNNVDENCDGIKAYDRDEDGYLAPPAGDDCDDRNPRRHPGAHDIPGNGVDEDCNGHDEPLKPFLAIPTLRYRVIGAKTRIRALLVRPAPARATITLRCRGSGCRKRSKRIHTKHRRKQIVVTQQLRRMFGRRRRQRLDLRRGTVIDVAVTKPHRVGFERIWRLRRGTDPASSDYCIIGKKGRRECG